MIGTEFANIIKNNKEIYMQRNTLSKWTLIMFAIIASSFPFYAARSSSSINQCDLVTNFGNQIERDRESLYMMRRIQADYFEAKNLIQRVGDEDNIHEILLLAEALEEESNLHAESRSRNAYGVTGTSVGSVILATYIVRKVNADTRGLSLRQRVLRGTILPERGQRLRRYGFNSALVFNMISTFWLVKEYRKNNNQINYLAEVIDQLNRLKDLSEEINLLESQIQSKEIVFEERVMQLEDMGLAKITSDGLKCL